MVAGPSEVSPYTEDTGLRRFSPFRKRGGVALQASVGVVECHEEVALGEEETLFGLEAHLTEYNGLWQEHFGVVTDFLNDEVNEALLGAIITESKGAPGNRNERRTIEKLQAGDFPQFAAIFVTAGRYRAALQDNVDTNGSVTNIWGSAMSAAQDHNRIDAKKAGLLDNLKHAPSSTPFHEKLIALEKQSYRTYKPIVKKEQKMGDIVLGHIAGRSDQAARLIDAFLDAAVSEVTIERNFAAFLANDYLMRTDWSLLGISARIIEQAAGDGVFASRFLQSRIEEQDGDNMLAFFARSLQRAGVKTPLAEYLARDMGSWPTDLAKSHDEYVARMVNTYVMSVKRQSERSVRKIWLHPDVNAYEDTVDRLFKKLHLRYENASYNRPVRQSSRNDRWRPSPSDALQVQLPPEEQAKLSAGVLVATNSGLITEAAPAVKSILEKIMSRDQLRDASFVADIARIIEHLQDNPYGDGVRHLVQVKLVQVNGTPTKIFRASPSHLAIDGYTYKASKRTKQARVIFSVATDSLAVFKVPGDHDEYERLINLLRR